MNRWAIRIRSEGNPLELSEYRPHSDPDCLKTASSVTKRAYWLPLSTFCPFSRSPRGRIGYRSLPFGPLPGSPRRPFGYRSLPFGPSLGHQESKKSPGRKQKLLSPRAFLTNKSDGPLVIIFTYITYVKQSLR